MTDTYRRVTRIDDDRPCPTIGAVLGHEDDDRVLVVWGDAALNPDAHRDEARVEYLDELTPVRRRS